VAPPNDSSPDRASWTTRVTKSPNFARDLLDSLRSGKLDAQKAASLKQLQEGVVDGENLGGSAASQKDVLQAGDPAPERRNSTPHMISAARGTPSSPEDPLKTKALASNPPNALPTTLQTHSTSTPPATTPTFPLQVAAKAPPPHTYQSIAVGAGSSRLDNASAAVSSAHASQLALANYVQLQNLYPPSASVTAPAHQSNEVQMASVPPAPRHRSVQSSNNFLDGLPSEALRVIHSLSQPDERDKWAAVTSSSITQEQVSIISKYIGAAIQQMHIQQMQSAVQAGGDANRKRLEVDQTQAWLKAKAKGATVLPVTLTARREQQSFVDSSSGMAHHIPSSTSQKPHLESSNDKSTAVMTNASVRQASFSSAGSADYVFAESAWSAAMDEVGSHMQVAW